MKKLILFFSFIIFSHTALAQLTGDEADGPVKNLHPVFPNGQSVEDQMVYFKTGQSVGQLQSSRSVVLNAIGYVRYNNEFIYGLEYSSYYAKDISTRAQLIDLVLGYRHVWEKRFIPYAIIQFGTAKIDGNGLSANGVNTVFDIGADIMKFSKVKASLGMRKNYIMSSEVSLQDPSFTDLYVTLGFVW